MLVQFLARSPSTNINVRKVVVLLSLLFDRVHRTQETDGGWRSFVTLNVQDLRVAVNQGNKRCGEQDSGE